MAVEATRVLRSRQVLPREEITLERFSFVGCPEQFKLNHACMAIVAAYGSHVYQVGSSLKKRDYRDVDVRCMLPDEQFEKLFGESGCTVYNARLSLLNCAISDLLASQTGLAVDFQFQKRSEANEKYPGPRSALGLTHWDKSNEG